MTASSSFHARLLSEPMPLAHVRGRGGHCTGRRVPPSVPQRRPPQAASRVFVLAVHGPDAIHCLFQPADPFRSSVHPSAPSFVEVKL